jgi:hypothetical protein
MIPYDPTTQPIAVITPSGNGNQGAYPVPEDSKYTYTPIQIDYCGSPKGKRFTKYYVTGTDTKTGVVTKYPAFDLGAKPYHFIPAGGPNTSKVVSLVKGTKKTYQASWSYDEKDVQIKGYYIIFGDKWGQSFPNGDVFPNLGSVYIDGAKATSGQFTLKDDMDVNRIVLSVSSILLHSQDSKADSLVPSDIIDLRIGHARSSSIAH